MGPGSCRVIIGLWLVSNCSNLVADRFEAKFHYASWSQTGPRLVADLLARVSSLLVS